MAALRAVLRSGAALVLGALVVAGVVATPIAATGHDGPVDGQVLGAVVHALNESAPTQQSDKVPLLEVFTATWCPPCAPADRAIDRILAERAPAYQRAPNGSAWPDPAAAPARVAVLAYHPHPDLVGEDRFGIPEGHGRLADKHDAFWFPSVYVDGYLEDAPETRTTAVDAGMEEIAYGSYTRLLDRAAAVPAVAAWNVSATTEGRNVTVKATLTGQAAVEGAVFVQGALWEDHVRFAGSNGIEDHRMTVREMLQRHVRVGGLDDGETWQLTWSFAAPAGIDLDAAGVTLFVEAAWSAADRDDPRPMMGFALGTAAVAATAIVVMRVRTRKGGKGEQ